MDLFALVAARLGVASAGWQDAVVAGAIATRAENLATARPEWQSRLLDIAARARAGLPPWAETELVQSLWLMGQHQEPNEVEPACVRAEYFAGIKEREDELSPGWYRRPDRAEWIEVTPGGVTRHRLPGFRVEGADFWTYPPHPGFFEDVLLLARLEHLYPPFESVIDEEALAALVQKAVSFTREYSPELASAISRLLSAVILIPPTARSLSSNLGLRFLRAVFVNPWVRATDPHLLATSIAHEYYHQSCWLLRAEGRLEGILDPAQRIRSPLSGYEADTLSIMDGLLIFISNLDYFNHAFRAGWALGENFVPLHARREKLAARLPELVTLLRAAVRPGSPAATYVEVLTEVLARVNIPR